jgi:hypothetical protein
MLCPVCVCVCTCVSAEVYFFNSTFLCMSVDNIQKGEGKVTQGITCGYSSCHLILHLGTEFKGMVK